MASVCSRWPTSVCSRWPTSGADGLPAALKEIPLEYFSRAVDLLEQHVHPGAIGILGGSRGAEAGLLYATRDKRIGCVVSVVGSGVLTQGIDFSLGRLDEILGHPTVPWTERGQPLPYLPNELSAEFKDRIVRGETVSLRDVFTALPTDAAGLDAVSIPVERIQGAVLLISAHDDQMWASVELSQVAADRLASHGHPFPWEHVVLAGAGHSIAGPPGAVQTSTTAPGPGVVFELGGTPERNAAARREAWDRTVAFLRAHLAVRG